ncbi:hypothetical protein HZ326_22413 [Fusarium oxysporum f. sp. albedinis]|nr:hypothetical protein HZ326_22413 [Fusarium oxysporum f. sp. albedinis]
MPELLLSASVTKGDEGASEMHPGHCRQPVVSSRSVSHCVPHSRGWCVAPFGAKRPCCVPTVVEKATDSRLNPVTSSLVLFFNFVEERREVENPFSLPSRGVVPPLYLHHPWFRYPPVWSDRSRCSLPTNKPTSAHPSLSVISTDLRGLDPSLRSGGRYKYLMGHYFVASYIPHIIRKSLFVQKDKRFCKTDKSCWLITSSCRLASLISIHTSLRSCRSPQPPLAFSQSCIHALRSLDPEINIQLTSSLTTTVDSVGIESRSSLTYPSRLRLLDVYRFAGAHTRFTQTMLFGKGFPKTTSMGSRPSLYSSDPSCGVGGSRPDHSLRSDTSAEAGTCSWIQTSCIPLYVKTGLHSSFVSST